MKITNVLIGIVVGIFMMYFGLRKYPTTNLGLFLITILGAIIIIISVISLEFKKKGKKNK